MTGIIILDGPDATGKTTLQEFLVKQYKAYAMHLTWTKELAPRMFEYQTQAMLDATQMSKDKLVVVDRHWISEKIYGNVMRGGSPWPLMGRMMDRVWRKHAALYIITLPPQNSLGFEIAIQRHKDNLDEKHPYNDDQFRQLLSGYSDWYDQNYTRQDVLPYILDFDGKDMLKFSEKALTRLDYLREKQYQPALNPNNQNILGHVNRSKVLFVGEKVNKKDNNYEWPFYEYRNSSLFLTEVFDELKIDETRIMLANALNEDGSINKLIKDLVIKYHLKTICMGKVAYEIIESQGIRTKQIMHPSYAARFQKREEFKKEIVEGMTCRSEG